MESIQQEKKTGRGPNHKNYKLKVTNVKTGETHHFITSKDVTAELNIPESTIYYMLRQENNTAKNKHTEFMIHRCCIPVFKQVKNEI